VSSLLWGIQVFVSARTIKRHHHRQAISLPSQSVIVGEVGQCVGVRWRADGGVGVLRTGPVAAGVRVSSSVSHLQKCASMMSCCNRCLSASSACICGWGALGCPRRCWPGCRDSPVQPQSLPHQQWLVVVCLPVVLSTDGFSAVEVCRGCHSMFLSAWGLFWPPPRLR